MIGYSMMMWFVTFVLLILAISLLKGNVSSVHGKVFDGTDDKAGYAKKMGKPCILISIGTFLSGFAAIMIEEDMAILYAISVVLAAAAISVIWFVQIQKRYRNKDKELTRKQNE